MAAWCQARGVWRGQTLSAGQVWALALAWYGSRLSPDYHGRTPAQVQAIFDSLGLAGEFWSVT